jgi:putative ABC transport system ATP-binding protein
MLELKNIDVTLHNSSNKKYKILQQLNLTINQGELIIIIGRNGTGKSTVFNVISGTIIPNNGQIMLDNRDITFTPPHKRSLHIAKVIQDPKIGTIENMTILENMAFAYQRGTCRRLQLYNNAKNKKLFQDKLATLNMGLENRLDMLVANLSGGQRQALSLIMAILANSKVLLLDEITAALDPKVAEDIMQLAMHIIAEEKLTTIMITHNMTHALQYGDRILLLANGKFTKEFNKEDKSSLTTTDLEKEFNGI